KDDNTVTVRTIKTGTVDGDLTQVTDGLAAGEKVVADGADKLREGARVETADRSAAPAKGNSAGAAATGGRKKGGRRPRENGDAASATVPSGSPPGETTKGGSK